VNIVDTLTFSGLPGRLYVSLRAYEPANFNPTGSYFFHVAHADKIDGFSSNLFTFLGNGLWPRSNGWGFVARVVDNQDLYFDYVQGGQMLVIPEPNVLLLWVSSLATIYAARRRLNGNKNKKNKKPTTTAS
jgi:hypothetical protein